MTPSARLDATMLLDAWATVRPKGWRLEIAGPDEAGHRGELERQAATLDLADAVSFTGPLDGPAKSAALSTAELLVLPSHSESFGMAIAEALAHEAPVLTTTAAPWPALIEHQCGWWVEPSVAGLSEGLRAATASNDATLCAMGERGRALVAADFSWDRVARQFVDAYSRLIGA